MLQGDIKSMNFDKPLEIKAYQYDELFWVGLSYHLEQLEII